MIALRSGAEFSVIGSFRYASVLWAIAIGYVAVGRRAQRAGDGRHRRDRGRRPLHPAPRARAHCPDRTVLVRGAAQRASEVSRC